jgi:hypothetical protein
LNTDTRSPPADPKRVFAQGNAMRISIMKYVFLAGGLLFLTVAICSVQSTRTFLGQASTARGTVIDMVRRQSNDSDTYAPVVRFSTEMGETIEFTSSTSSNPPGYRTGESVEILYRPIAPRDARINDFGSLWASPLMFGTLGSVFFSIGAGILLRAILMGRKAADLKRNGNKLLTTVQRVELNGNLQVNGKSPYRIFTQWKNPAKPETRVFESDYVWFDPSSYLNGRSVAVFVEPRNPDRYYVDLSFLPKTAH